MFQRISCTVDIWQMRDYVDHGAALPEKPILIHIIFF